MEIIDKIFIVENATCIYRNFSFLNTKGKLFAVLCTLVECFLFGINIYNVIEDATMISLDSMFIISYTILSRFYSLFVIYMAFKNADAYKIFCLHINAVYVEMKTCKIIKQSLKKVKIYGMLIISFFLINDTIMIIRFVIDFLPFLMDSKRSTKQLLLFATNSLQFMLSEYRYFIELVALIVLINIICLALYFTNLTLNNTLKILENGDLESEVVSELKSNISKIETVAYHISASNDQVTKIFGVQIVCALFCASIYFMFLLYKGIYSVISQAVRNRLGNSNTLFLLFNYITVPMLTMHAGQKAQNEADRVIKMLAKVHNMLLISRGDGVEDLKKAVTNLHRQISRNPVRIKMISQVFLHMPILPDIVNFVISYTIIFLQFNHVV